MVVCGWDNAKEGRKAVKKLRSAKDVEVEDHDEGDGDEGGRDVWGKVVDVWGEGERSLALRVLKARSDGVVGEYGEREDEKRRVFTEGGQNSKDPDGWTTVSYKQSGIEGGRREIEGMMDGSLTAEEHVRINKGDKGRKRKRKLLAPSSGLDDFYRFQIKEVREGEVRRLQDGMRKDRERVKRMVKGKMGKR